MIASEIMQIRHQLHKLLMDCDGRLDIASKDPTYRDSTVFRLLLEERKRHVDGLSLAGFFADDFQLKEAM